jgi:glycogen debranching enzyme
LIRFEEHTYFDNPLVGHPDVRTRLKDAEYFFFGNGLIHGAVQYSPFGEGSPFGLLIMNPEKLTMKRNAFTMDKSEGLSGTALSIYGNGLTGRFDNQGTIRWKTETVLPVIDVSWKWRDIKITELFYCPDRKNPVFIREINLENLLPESRKIKISTSVPGKILNQKIILSGNEQKNIYISYSIVGERSIKLELLNGTGLEESLVFWENKARIKTNYKTIEKFFSSSVFQLASMISANGKMDASIWQYNREWVRDHSFMCLGLIYTGHYDLAKIFLERLISEFVSDEGDTKDSSEKRHYDEVELDQNGELLYALNEYLKWTGDNHFIIKHNEKITSIAEFPLKPDFRDKESGLLHNSREYWERHSIHGIADGFEFAYQMWVVKGLLAAALMARKFSFGYPDKWENEAARLLDSLMNDKKSGFIYKGSFIKRKDRNGQVVKTINPKCPDDLPKGIPLISPGDHLLNPDSSVSQAIVYDMIDPHSDLAINSMETIEELWNQTWKGGGYARYNMTSEPDSPGPWPFPSLFIARAYMRMGKYDKVVRVLNWLNDIPGRNSGSWFEYYGERISPPYPQVGIPPWTWAEVIMLVIKDMLGIEPEGDYIRVKPVLLPRINYFEATIPVREMIIDLKIIRTNKEKKSKKVLIPIIKGSVSVSIEI